MEKYILLGKIQARYKIILTLQDKIKYLESEPSWFNTYGNRSTELDVLKRELKELGVQYAKSKCYFEKTYKHEKETLKNSLKSLKEEYYNINRDKALDLLEVIKVKASQIQVKVDTNPQTNYYYEKEAKKTFFTSIKEELKYINKVLAYINKKTIQYNDLPRKVNKMDVFFSNQALNF